MSYARMDHAGWVQEQINYLRNPAKPTAAEKRAGAQGKGWLAAPEKLSPFHERVFDILGIVGGGIYNAPIDWDKVEWKYSGSDSLSLIWQRYMPTWDSNPLTSLVILSHQACIRAEVEPKDSRSLRLSFFQRYRRTGGVGERHPDIHQAVSSILTAIGPEHRINYAGEPPEEEKAA